MEFSFGAVISCIIILVCLSIFSEAILHAKPTLFERSIRFIFWGIILLAMRATIPFNFPFTITVRLEKGMVVLTDFFLLTEIGNHSLFFWCIVVWMFGAFAFLLHMIMMYWRFRNGLRQAVRIGHVNKEKIEEVLKKYFFGSIDIAVLPGVFSPFISGVLHPVLVVPDQEFKANDLDYIICHEIMHYNKRDLLLKLLVDFFTCIYWWNPIIYAFKKKFLLSVEIANDIAVISCTKENEKWDYISCLIRNSKSCTNMKIFGIPFANKKDLQIRVSKVLNYNGKQKGELINIACMMLVWVFVILGVVVVPEAYSVPEYVEETTFSVDDGECYFIQNGSEYDLYVDDIYEVTIPYIYMMILNIYL